MKLVVVIKSSMNKPETIDLIDDRMSKRFESLAKTMIELHEDHNKQMLEMVSKQIKETVNGKIDRLNDKTDKQDEILKRLDERLQPFEYTRSWFMAFKDGVSWVAGFITPVVIVGGAVLWFVNEIKK